MNKGLYDTYRDNKYRYYLISDKKGGGVKKYSDNNFDISKKFNKPKLHTLIRKLFREKANEALRVIHKESHLGDRHIYDSLSKIYGNPKRTISNSKNARRKAKDNLKSIRSFLDNYETGPGKLLTLVRG